MSGGLTGLSGISGLSALVGDGGGGPVPGAPPEYAASETGDINRVTVEVVFDQDIFSPSGNYADGVTIKNNTVTQTILNATRQANHAIVHYEISLNGDANDVFSFEYDDLLGDLEAEDDGVDMADVSAQTPINYIGSHFYFDTEDDAVWLAAVV